ncbi:glycosyltransferase family 9 protein [Thermodesulfovibrio yellowstonii]|uniref:Glycosyl transferase, family 9 n=1 Tax=Thermodesulfovibrio yellowstonii (strain ATCC 51303 / DSM 11347 / YP87) TaxID=289376 RepID=B5YJ60_THEYD|nr:glycosyltransferase family 9 protein [Thermodesulfovibrio yellowstonii]ACI21165.1 glycosyl transferase, family 9 [Thermodesulfovibrio yellowstonii DSM 11347]
MIYLILTYIFYPFIYILTSLKGKNKVSKILIIQTAKIGDLICSTPVFREIKKTFPHIKLSVIVTPTTKELLELNPHVDEIIAIKPQDYKGFWGKIKLAKLIYNGKYDIGIALNPSVLYAISLFWGLVPIRLSVMPNFSGLTFKLASKLFTYVEPHVSGQLVIETYMKMLRFIDIDKYDLRKEVYKSEEAEMKVKEILGKTNKTLIGIAVSSANKLKELGVEKIIDLVDKLLENLDAQIVLIGNSQDTNNAEIIKVTSKNKGRVINTAGIFNLKELPVLIEKLSLFIGVDTGITYMADALNIPLINIAGPSNMEDQRPLGEKVVIIQKTDLHCVPCSHVFKSPYDCETKNRDCIELIEIDEIVEKIKKFYSLNTNCYETS